MDYSGPWRMGSVTGGGGVSARVPGHHPTTPGAAYRPAGRGGSGLLLLLQGGLLLLLMTRAAGGRHLHGTGGRHHQNVEQSPDGCDRTIWSSPAEPRAVHQLQVRCAEGAISWQQADGALRVLLDSPASLRTGKQLETCLSISSHLLKVVISTETQGEEGMVPLAMLTREYPRTGKDLCVRTQSPVSVFLETQPGEDNLGLGYVKIRYDVTTISKNEADNMEECRPCTDDELLLAVCSMDFAVSGKMTSVLHSNILEQTTIDVKVDRIYRQKGHHFANSHEHSHLRRNVRKLSDFSADVEADSGRGTIVAPYKCGIRYGQGDFLFVGRMRLGRALLLCAPRMEEFNEVWAVAVRTEHNLCNLD